MTEHHATVLVVEDDPAIRMGLVDALGFEGYGVIQADTAPAGRDAALRDRCDCVLLDLMLPGGDGFSVLSEVRRLKPRLPIIILTARGREADRVRGLRLGADDYVVKPFSVRELLARVEAVMRRAPPTARESTKITIPGGHADLARREVVFDDGELTELAEREVALLAYLAQHPDRAVGRDELLEKIWRVNPERTQTRTVDMHVARLREKLRDTTRTPSVIVTVRGKGYKFGGPA
ncbi:MAG: response regulator transcription factor [Nannocystaceae bacterium]|nr:response regulator transcription factor [bacterium]